MKYELGTVVLINGFVSLAGGSLIGEVDGEMNSASLHAKLDALGYTIDHVLSLPVPNWKIQIYACTKPVSDN